MDFYSKFAEHYESIFPFEGEVYSFLRRYISDEDRIILDVGCGTGHYCGRLAADGFQSVGIDLDQEMIDVARHNYPDVPFHCMDMLEIASLSTRFDFVFCIGNVASHLKQSHFKRFVQDVRSVLRPGGVWLLQIVNWDYALKHGRYPFPIITVGSDVEFVREYREISEERVHFLTCLRTGSKTVFEGDVWLHPIATPESLSVHKQNGFWSLGHFADFKGSPFDPDTQSSSVFVFRNVE